MSHPDLQRLPPTVGSADRRRVIKEIIAALEQSAVIQDPPSRQMLLHELDLALGRPVSNLAANWRRSQLVELATSCIEHAAGLRSLADCLDVFEPRSQSITALLRLADEWQAMQQFAAHDLNWLRLELSQIAISDDALRLVAAHHTDPVPAHCASTWHLFAHLATLNTTGGVPLWLRLLERSVPRVRAVSRSTLRDLVAALREEWIPTPDVTDERTNHAQPDSTDGGTAYLVIQFERYGPSQDVFILSHWYQWISSTWQPVRGEDRRVHRADLEAAVDQIVLEAERRWARLSGPVTIEFVLPWQLLNEPVDTWRKELASPEPSQLASVYPVVIRSLERIRADQWHRLWRTRWTVLKDVPAGSDPVYCATEGQGGVQLEAILNRLDTAVVLVLSEPPLPQSTGERQLLSGIRSGIPAIVWHRQRSGIDLCKIVASTLDSDSATIDIARLPQRVSKLRQAAWSDDPRLEGRHAGHGLVILWDDPERQPGRAGFAGSDAGKVRA